MLCEFANGARGTFEASRTIVGPESQMAFEVYGTKGALGWNLERSTSCRSTSPRTSCTRGYRTVFGGDRFPYHGHFVPGQRERHRLRGPRRDRGLRVLPRASPSAGRTRPASTTRWRACACRRRCCESVRSPAAGRTCADHDRHARIGVIGAGRIGSMHAELLARRVPGAAVTRIHDVLADNAREVAARSACPSPPALDELLGAADVDAVAICTSTDTHADLIVAAAQAGKAIFCEKPVSLDLAEVDRALAAVEAAGVPFQSASTAASTRPAAVAAAVADGEVGEPQLVRISSRDPAPPPLAYVSVSGGIFLDMTIHDFDMARFVTGSEVVEVYARGSVQIDPGFGKAGDVDTAVVTARARQRLPDDDRQLAPGRLRLRPARRGLRLGGMAASENPLAHSAIVRSAAGSRAATLPYFYLERYIPSYLREWEAFVGAVTAGETPPVTGSDARAPLVIGMAAWQSLREGRPSVYERCVRRAAARRQGARRHRRHAGPRRRDSAARARLGAAASSVCGRDRERGEAVAAELDASFVEADLARRRDRSCRAVLRALRPHRRARQRRRAQHARHDRRHDASSGIGCSRSTRAPRSSSCRRRRG